MNIVTPAQNTHIYKVDTTYIAFSYPDSSLYATLPYQLHAKQPPYLNMCLTPLAISGYEYGREKHHAL